MEFSTGLHYLDVGLGIALFAGICWWTYALTSRSYAQHKLERIVRKAAGKHR